MAVDKENEKKNSSVIEELNLSVEGNKYQKMLTGKDIKKFKLIPRKIKRLSHRPNYSTSGINISEKHIDMQMTMGTKMIIRKEGNDKKFKPIDSKNVRL